MAQDHHSSPPHVPADLVAKHREGWHAFTRMALWNSVAVAGLLLVLLLIFKVF